LSHPIDNATFSSHDNCARTCLRRSFAEKMPEISGWNDFINRSRSIGFIQEKLSEGIPLALNHADSRFLELPNRLPPLT
jgi:hypothetical protein